MNYLEATRGEHIFKKLVSSDEMFMFFYDVKYFWRPGVVFREETHFFQIVLFLSSFPRVVSGNRLYFFEIFNHFAGGMIPAN